MIRYISALLMALFLIHCGGDSGNNRRDELVGTWILIALLSLSRDQMSDATAGFIHISTSPWY